jgi:hypothetical protein
MELGQGGKDSPLSPQSIEHSSSPVYVSWRRWASFCFMKMFHCIARSQRQVIQDNAPMPGSAPAPDPSFTDGWEVWEEYRGTVGSASQV